MNQIIIDCILCFIGILVYFMNRYANRQNKTKLSWKYWWNDNAPEFFSTLLLNIALMILIHLPDSEVSFTKVFEQLPFGLKLAGVPTLSFLLGLGLSAIFYSLFKTKTKIKK